MYMHHKHRVPSFSKFGIKSQEAPLVLYVPKRNLGLYYYTQRWFLLSLSLRKDESSVRSSRKAPLHVPTMEAKFIS